MMKIILSVNERGTLTLPLKIRKQLGIPKGGQLMVQTTKDGITLLPGAVFPIEIYSDERAEEFYKRNEKDLEDFKF